jgi:hypothetical protein
MRAPERKLSQSKFERAAFLCPPDAPQRTRCTGCKQEFPIPWESQLKFEYEPFTSADGATWVMAGLPLDCPHCNGRVWFEIDTTPNAGVLEFFGDEAFRAPIKGWYPLSYGLIAIYEEHIASLRKQFLSLKHSFIPQRAPDSWVLHVKDLRDQKKREHLARDITIERANEFLREMSRWIGKNNDKLAIYIGLSISRVAVGPNTPHKAKEAFFNSCRNLLMKAILPTVTDSCTRSNLTPQFAFEAQSRITHQPFVEEWIERISRGQRLSLMHHYIARGHELTIPRSIPKGADFRLELADLLAFSMARHIHCLAIDRASEINLEDFGTIQYGAFSGRSFGIQSGVGFPWHHFYGDEKF